MSSVKRQIPSPPVQFPQRSFNKRFSSTNIIYNNYIAWNVGFPIMVVFQRVLLDVKESFLLRQWTGCYSRMGVGLDRWLQGFTEVTWLNIVMKEHTARSTTGESGHIYPGFGPAQLIWTAMLSIVKKRSIHRQLALWRGEYGRCGQTL